MADSSFKYTHNGSASGYSYSNGKVSGSSPYTVGGHPIGTYTVGGQPVTHAPAGVGSRLTGNPSGGIGVLQNLGGQIADTIHSIPNVVVQTAEQVKYDFGKGGTESLSQAWNDPRGLIGGSVKPQVEVTKQDASALRKGDWHYFEQHPLNPILDAAAIASLGGKGALIGAKAGVLGKGAQDLATSERVLQVGDHSEILNQSETLQGRARQRAFDRWSQAHPDVSVIGGHERMLKILNKRAASMTLRAGLPVRAFQRLTNGLTPPEVFAFHVGVEGVPLDDRIAYYQRQLAEGTGATRYQQQYLQNLMAPDVRAVLENPRPEFVAALHAGKDLEAKAGERLVAAGSLAPETRAERAALPQREMMGAGPPTVEPKPGLVSAVSVPDPEGANATHVQFGPSEPIEFTRNGQRVQTTPYTDFGTFTHWGDQGFVAGLRIEPGLRANRRLVIGLRDTVLSEMQKSGVSRLVPDPFGMTEDGLRMWRNMARRIEAGKVPGWRVIGGDLQRGARVGDMGGIPLWDFSGQHFERVPVAAGPSMDVNLVHPDFPAPYRFPHVGKRGTAGLFTAPKVEDMRGKARPLMQLRHNAAIRLRNAIMLTDPASVLSTDYLQTMRHEHVLQMQHEALDPISQPLSADHVGTGFKHQNEWYYRPSYDRKQTAPIPRSVQESEAFDAERHRQAMGREEMVTSEQAKQTSATESAKGVVSQNLSDLGVAPGDLHNLEKLDEMGIRRVPAAFGRDFTKEFGGTHRAIRLFYDRPLDVWRAITLNYRPAWAVNNFIGNALMGLATYGPEGAAAYLHVLLSTERGEDKVLKLWKYTKRIPTLRRKYAGVFQEVAPELHSAGLFGTQTKITHPGVYEQRLEGFKANPAIKAVGLATRPVTRSIMAVGRGITKAEVLLAEDTGREAAFIREAGGDIAHVRKVAKAMGEGNLSLAESLKRLDRGSVERAVQRVNDALGDFNDLSHTERAVLRRIIPFYSWYKVITKVSGKYVARYPARVLLLKNIAAAQNTAGEPALPEWLRGSIMVGGPSGGVQTLISTQGINPYETINQTSTGGPGGLISPFLTPLIIGATGRDPTFGGLADYHGLGATNRQGWQGFLERAGGSAVSGLAPFRVAQQTTQPYQGKLYAPHTYGHVGPVSVNDFLLQYLGLPIRHVNVAEARKQSGLK